MKWVLQPLLFLLLANFVISPAFAADDMCKHLKKFVRTSFDSSEKPEGRRWIELYWRGSWLDLENGFGLECRNSPDLAASKFCSYLLKNSSFEFRAATPMRMLTCYGYDFPSFTGWRHWVSEIDIVDDDNFVLLEVNFSEDIDSVIRLSAFAEGMDETLAEMPPLYLMSSPERVQHDE